MTLEPDDPLSLTEDYEGHPQRRDFPVGGEPVIFTFDETPPPRRAPR